MLWDLEFGPSIGLWGQKVDGLTLWRAILNFVFLQCIMLWFGNRGTYIYILSRSISQNQMESMLSCLGWSLGIFIIQIIHGES